MATSKILAYPMFKKLFAVRIKVVYIFLSQIQQIREAFPNISKENAAIVLQSCDCNIEKAVTLISQGIIINSFIRLA